MTPLTPRETEVCREICRGLEAKEIAAKLGVSARTVDDHRAAIKRKFGVRNAVELVRAVYGITDEART